MRNTTFFISLIASALAACGGGGGGGTPTLNTFTLYPASDPNDGYFRSDGAHAPSSGNEIAVGANGTAFVAGYVRFSHGSQLAPLAAAGRVTSVLLSLHSRGSGGSGNAAADHGQIYVQHTDFGAVIDGSDYAAIGTFIPDGVIQWGNGTPVEFLLDVTDEVLADVLAGYTDIYLMPTGDAADDSYWFIEDVDGLPLDLGAPHLIVEYGE